MKKYHKKIEFNARLECDFCENSNNKGSVVYECEQNHRHKVCKDCKEYLDGYKDKICPDNI